MDVLSMLYTILALFAVLAIFLVVLLSGDADFSTRFSGDPGAGEYRGKVVLITGASSGIGEALASKYALAGASGLVLVGRDRARLLATAKAAAASAEKSAVRGGRTWTGVADDSFGLGTLDSPSTRDEDDSDEKAASKWTPSAGEAKPAVDILCIVMDVTNEEERRRLVARVATRFGRGGPSSLDAEPAEDKTEDGHHGPVRAREERAPLVDVMISNAGRSQRALAEETAPE